MADAEAPFRMTVEPSHVLMVLDESVQSVEWAELAEFGTRVAAELEGRTRPSCVVDLSDLKYMPSAMVALIVRIWKVVSSKNGQMIVVCPHPVVREVIALAGLDRIWQIVPTRDVALRSLGRRTPSPARPQPAAVESSSPQTATSSQSPRRSRKLIIMFIIGILIVAIIAALVQTGAIPFVRPLNTLSPSPKPLSPLG